MSPPFGRGNMGNVGGATPTLGDVSLRNTAHIEFDLCYCTCLTTYNNDIIYIYNQKDDIITNSFDIHVGI
jgi:hypothetical protein